MGWVAHVHAGIVQHQIADIDEVAVQQESPHRFGELRRRIEGVSEKMLAQSLQTLERDGWVHREVRSAIPPHVEYRLTDAGAELVPHLLALIGFVEERMPAVRAARAAADEVRPPR